MNRKELVEQIFAKKSFLCVGLDQAPHCFAAEFQLCGQFIRRHRATFVQYFSDRPDPLVHLFTSPSLLISTFIFLSLLKL